MSESRDLECAAEVVMAFQSLANAGQQQLPFDLGVTPEQGRWRGGADLLYDPSAFELLDTSVRRPVEVALGWYLSGSSPRLGQ